MDHMYRIMSKSKSKINSKTGSKTTKAGSKGRKIEDKYQKLDPIEHVLKRPGMYIGSIKSNSYKLWIWNSDAKKEDQKIILKKISMVPGFYKICDEVIVNAADHTVTTKDSKNKCNKIKINVDKSTGWITVWNNGDGIDVVKNKDHDMMVPTMVFGELRSGTNYDDDEETERITGGMNGLGAKLTNIYSLEFIVETLDAERELKFYQKFSKNMSEISDAKITSAKGKKPYTQISFLADFEKFGMKGISTDVFNLLKRRAYDLAATTNAKVFFNDELIEQTNLQKYVELYFPSDSDSDSDNFPKAFDLKSNDRWKIGVVFDKSGKFGNQCISFVNGISTNNGGTHVDHITKQVITEIKKIVSKKIKTDAIKNTIIKESLIFFVDAVVNKPEFDSQSKDRLKTPVKDFGSECKLTNSFLNAIANTGIVEYVINKATILIENGLGKTDGKKVNRLNIPKLNDADAAGTKESEKCCLFLTEGDSAKAMAMAGFNVTGRKYFGVFPLRGKLTNVSKKVSVKDIEKMNENKEIAAIKKIVGLKHGVEYKSLKDLRYGQICILTDQDVDGYHIKGLIMNFIHKYWPSLIKYEGFITSFPTPYVKASKRKDLCEFYSIPEFQEWKEDNNDGKGWNIKFYKGLGTSTPKEAQGYFKHLENMLTYYCPPEPKKEEKISNKSKKDEKKSKDSSSGSGSGSSSGSSSGSETEITEKESKKAKLESVIKFEVKTQIDTYKPKYKDPTKESFSLLFDKERADHRKIWMNQHDSKSYLDTSKKKKVAYPDFFNLEMRQHSIYNAERNIPNLMDGLKTGQRKIFYTGVIENIYGEAKEMRVAQLGPEVSKKTAYHHGEASLFETIIKMAQNYVGSNNLNLLYPQGMFGTRLCGGDDAASPRYIHTFLTEISKKIFVNLDFDILEHQVEEGLKIEPVFYAAIIPMILINGTGGIGTGYSSTIEPCNPRDVIANIYRILRGESPVKMMPWYRHFTGTVARFVDEKGVTDKKKFVIRANYTINGDNLHITDLPIGTWTDNYLAFLIGLVSGDKTSKKGKATQTKTAQKKTAQKKTGSKAGSKTRKNAKTKKNAQNSRTAKVAKSNKIGSLIKSYTESCTDVKIDITITFHPGALQEIDVDKLEKNLKLMKTVKLTNMHLFNEEGKIFKYESYGEILVSYARVRLELYQKRKDYLLDKWEKDLELLKWKIRFIEHVIDGKIVFFRDGKTKNKAEIDNKLEELEFPKFSEDGVKSPNYFYTRVGIYNFTTEELEKLRKEYEEKKTDIKILQKKTPADIWKEELDEFMIEYDKWEKQVDEDYQSEINGNKKSKVNKKSDVSKKSSSKK